MAFKEKLDSVFRLTEDIIYILISLLLILTALFIMVSSVLDFFPISAKSVICALPFIFSIEFF